MYEEIENKLGGKIQGVKVLKSGWSGEIISINLSNCTNKYIIKTYKSSTEGLENIKREWMGLNLLYNANYSVPRPILNSYENNSDPYFVMEEIEGDNLWTCYTKSSNEDKGILLDKFVEAFYKLHQLDVSIVDKKYLEDLTDSFIKKEINDIEELIEKNNFHSFLEVISWLNNNMKNINKNTLSIIHRDYHPWNVIVDSSEKVYVIDLLWGIGDYRFDLAWTCTLMERSGYNKFSDKLLKKYEELKGKSIDDFEYFKVLATLRWLVNVNISLLTGENLNETRKEEFKAFIFPLIQNGIKLIENSTHISITI